MRNFLGTKNIIISHGRIQTRRVDHAYGHIILLSSQTFHKASQGKLGSTVRRSFRQTHLARKRIDDHNNSLTFFQSIQRKSRQVHIGIEVSLHQLIEN